MSQKTDAQLRTDSTNEILGKTYAPGRADTFNQNMIDSKANNDSPTFIGTPTLPTGTVATTQTAGDNSTKIATTAFVTSSISAGVNAGSKIYMFNNFT